MKSKLKLMQDGLSLDVYDSIFNRDNIASSLRIRDAIIRSSIGDIRKKNFMWQAIKLQQALILKDHCT